MKRWLSAPPWSAAISAALLMAVAASGADRRDLVTLTNPLLSPAYSQILVGPLGLMASDEEIERFATLRRDEEAEAFLEEFWRRRDPDPERPGNPERERYEERAAEADQKFSEAGYVGRRTDRGTIWILHGEPEEMDYEINPEPRGGPPIEAWKYPRSSPPGLDGKKPRTRYRFIREGDLTGFYRPSPRLPARRTPGG